MRRSLTATAPMLLMFALASCSLAPSITSGLPVRPPIVPPANRIVGVFEPYDPGSYWQVRAFAKAVRMQPRLVVYYSDWGAPFSSHFAGEVHLHGGKPLVQIDPRQVSFAGIASGNQDGYLRSYAQQVRAYRYPVVLSFGQEMNGSWYPWGADHVAPATFVAAWRHIVRLFRAERVKNAIWLWDVNCNVPGSYAIKSWWPGNTYVSWAGVDCYYAYRSDTFDRMFASTIAAIRRLTSAPVLIGETAAGPVAGQPEKIMNLFAGVLRYRLLGFVWFDQAQDNGPYHQDWRLEQNPRALAVFIREARNFLERRPS